MIWFFCIVFFSLANILLVVTRKPIKQADKADCADSSNFCPKCGQHFIVHNGDGSCIEDEPMEIDEMDEMNETEIDETPIPVINRTGKVTMLTENLSKCLNIVKDSVGSRTLPILNKVLIEFKNGMATFTTTNLETAIVTSCGCKIESEFACVLPFKILKDLSELLYDDIVVIEQSNDKSLWNRNSNLKTITLTQGKNVCTLFDDDPQDYPPMPKVEGQSVVISDLPDAIKKVKDKIVDSNWRKNAYAISSHANGLHFDLSKPNIVATDGNRMKIATLNCEKKDIQFRIDKECALILGKFKDMDCMVTSNEKQTRFDFGLYLQGENPMIKTTILTQNLQGTYPDYESLKESHKELVSVL
jgi:DNA polymerase III sliding clamp (beta) subunit (PCNA family)